MKTVEIQGVQAIATGELSDVIGFTVPVKTLTEIGVEPAGKIKAGTYWRVSDIPKILDALIDRLQRVRAAT